MRMDLPSDLPDNLDKIREMQRRDRALMDKANRAFVSYIHSYVKHECSVLLRVKGVLWCSISVTSTLILNVLILSFELF